MWQRDTSNGNQRWEYDTTAKTLKLIMVRPFIMAEKFEYGPVIAGQINNVIWEPRQVHIRQNFVNMIIVKEEVMSHLSVTREVCQKKLAMTI